MLWLSRETEFIFEMKFCLCLQGDKDTIESPIINVRLLFFNAFITQHIRLFLCVMSEHKRNFKFDIITLAGFVRICFHYMSNIPLVQNMTVC